MLLTEIGDVAGAGFEDPQAEQAQHGDKREVVPVGGGAKALPVSLPGIDQHRYQPTATAPHSY